MTVIIVLIAHVSACVPYGMLRCVCVSVCHQLQDEERRRKQQLEEIRKREAEERAKQQLEEERRWREEERAKREAEEKVCLFKDGENEGCDL